MRVTCVALEPDRSLRLEAEETALATWRAGGGPFWLDLQDGRTEEVAAWLAALGADPELPTLVTAPDGDTVFRPLPGAIFLSYPVPAADLRSQARFACVGLERLLVTVDSRQDPGARMDEVPLDRLRLPEPSTAGLLAGLTLLHAGRLRRRVVALRREGDRLTDRMDADPAGVTVAEILGLRRQALTLAGVVDEQQALLEVLQACDQPSLPMAKQAPTLHLALEMTRATDRDVERLDRRVGELHHRYEAAQQELTNRRLGTLTVLSAIFMPLTLIAGIYGMNFENMPLLRHPYGYHLTIGAMLAIAGGLAWFFRGWWSRR